MNEDTPPFPDLSPEEQDEVLAAELALGLVEGDEAQLIVSRLAHDPRFAQQVRDWQERFAGMAEDLTPVMPPARTRQHIRQELGHAQAMLSRSADSPPPVWRDPRALLGAGLAALLLLLAIFLPAWRDETPAWHAELASTEAGMRASARLEGREVIVTLDEGAAPEGRDWQAWWLAPGTAPVALGLLSPEGALRVELPEGLAPAEGVQVQVSDEPAGGASQGQPGGTVIATAPLVSG